MKTETEAKATERPKLEAYQNGNSWNMFEGDNQTGTIHDGEKARKYCKAVNAYDKLKADRDALLEALKETLEIAEVHVAHLKSEWQQENNSDDFKNLLVALEDEAHASIEIAKKAIAQAEGK